MICKLSGKSEIWEGEGVSLNPHIQSKEIFLLTDSILIGFLCPILSGINLSQ